MNSAVFKMSLNTSRFNSVLVTLQLWPHFHSLLPPYRCVLLFRTFSRINLGFFLLVFFSLAKKPINQSLRQIQPEQMKWNIFLTVICFFCWLCFVFFFYFSSLWWQLRTNSHQRPFSTSTDHHKPLYLTWPTLWPSSMKRENYLPRR